MHVWICSIRKDPHFPSALDLPPSFLYGAITFPWLFSISSLLPFLKGNARISGFIVQRRIQELASVLSLAPAPPKKGVREGMAFDHNVTERNVHVVFMNICIWENEWVREREFVCVCVCVCVWVKRYISMRIYAYGESTYSFWIISYILRISFTQYHRCFFSVIHTYIIFLIPLSVIYIHSLTHTHTRAHSLTHSRSLPPSLPLSLSLESKKNMATLLL